MLALKFSRRALNHHFVFAIGGITYSYTNIRKNACTASRRLIIETSPYQPSEKKGLAFLAQHHTAKTIQDVIDTDFRILILRDPIKRVQSVYQNKFINMSGHRDIKENLEKLTDKNFEYTSINDFVLDYLTLDWRGLDPHVWPQSAHLLPIDYNAVIKIDDLYRAMNTLLGKPLAEKYFAKPLNETKDKNKEKISLSAEAIALLNDIYRDDFELLNGRVEWKEGAFQQFGRFNASPNERDESTRINTG